MGKIPGGQGLLDVTMQASEVLGGVEGTNIYDQERCHKERDMQIQHWVIASLRVWWREKPLKEREAKRPHGSSSQSRAALHPMMLLIYKHHIRQVVC